jgi:eukaryotic-like serine/threonine-protein kinase
MIGEQFGNYRVLSLLGQGGMGAVYLAEHPSIGRRVAVKVLHREFVTDEQLLGRLLNEARAANAIRHPNIIEILDSGMRPDGTPYLVMELLEGESLGTRLRRVGALPLRDAVDFAYETASALGAAHKKGIVHRDLKPDNLFVSADEHDASRERIKVLDFGIAKLQQKLPGDSVKTRTGTLMGTPIYMSPEQCRGTSTIDHRSDVYSLGVILFEMLVGHPPFMSEGFGDLINMHLNVPPPSARAERHQVPDALDAVVIKMLAKNPEDRYPDMTALQGALKLAGGPDLAVHGAVPAILNQTTEPREAVAEHAPEVRTPTTFTAGIGERQSIIVRRGGGAKLAAAALGVALIGGGALFLARRGAPLSAPVATAETVAAPAPARGPSPAPAAPRPAAPAPSPTLAPAMVTVRVQSTPKGARVVNAADGDVLGETPLVLTRKRGGEVQLRAEKDGYLPAERRVPLDADRQLELTLQKRARPRAAPRRAADDEPAKL